MIDKDEVQNLIRDLRLASDRHYAKGDIYRRAALVLETMLNKSEESRKINWVDE